MIPKNRLVTLIHGNEYRYETVNTLFCLMTFHEALMFSAKIIYRATEPLNLC